MNHTSIPETLRFESGQLLLIDQTRLPDEVLHLACSSVDQVHDAISRLVVRGAPAIGIAAAYGVCLAESGSRKSYIAAMDFLATSRPTAVNLFWALRRMRETLLRCESDFELADVLINEARAIHDEDREMCRDIGLEGAAVLKNCKRVLTHCNAGGLATSMRGTALAPIYQLHENRHSIEVFADETRPLLQGARLTAWELSQAGIPVTVLTDSMSGSLMRGGHNVPFYVAAPTSTFDPELPNGDAIPIEERARSEISHAGNRLMVPQEARVMNPAFDVTPAKLITGIITEKGVLQSPITSIQSDFLSVKSEKTD
jgi:methylthioribose-1-phosphate isomerase